MPAGAGEVDLSGDKFRVLLGVIERWTNGTECGYVILRHMFDLLAMINTKDGALQTRCLAPVINDSGETVDFTSVLAEALLTYAKLSPKDDKELQSLCRFQQVGLDLATNFVKASNEVDATNIMTLLQRPILVNLRNQRNGVEQVHLACMSILNVAVVMWLL